ncbi:MAG: methylmalonyl-CoA mutase family protein [Bacteroidales bacterium]
MDQEKKSGLFEEFPPVSTQQWEAKIHEDLKGADYEKKLVWQTLEGIKVKPYYRAEHLEDIGHTHALPDSFPFVRGTKAKDNNWEVRQDFDEEDLATANELARKALERGAQALGLNAAMVTSAGELQTLLKDIDLSKAAVHFLHTRNYPHLLTFLTQVSQDKNLKGSFNFDPLGYLLMYGKYYDSKEANVEQAAELLKAAGESFPLLKVITVNGQHYNNAGASIVQELAFMLSQGNEYLATLTDKGFTVDQIAPRMQFNISIGSSYFLEIAKLRAIKLLWAKIVKQYAPEQPDAMKIFLHAETSSWNKSIYDPYVNMLRTTTEAMAAAIGGVDSMSVDPFDSTFKKPDHFSRRIARNQQIILKEESYFNKVVDPGAGSYYIENLTRSIAEAAWALFLETEEKGGFEKIVESNFIQQEIENTCQKRDMEVAMRKRVFVGTNQYPNAAERMLDKLQPTARLTDLGGLRQYRGTQAFEALRLAVENHERKGFDIPKVFLFTYGNLTMRKARASFSSNFFGVAGYQIIDNPGFKTTDDGVQAALDSGARIVVFCSSDEEYADMAAAAAKIKAQAPHTIIVVAGNPKEQMEQLDQAGVDHYIHVRTNVLDALTHFNNVMEIA